MFMGANGSEMAVGGFEATFLREFTVGGLVLGHPAGCEHASLTSSILIVSLRSQKGASFQPAHPHSPVSRARPLPVKPHLQQQPHSFPLCRPRPPFMRHDVALTLSFRLLALPPRKRCRPLFPPSSLVGFGPFVTSGEAGRGHASPTIGGPRLVDLVRQAALLLVVNCTFSFAWVSSPTPHTSGEASPRHASPAIGGRRLVDPVRRAADNLAVFLCLFFAWPRSSFRPLPLSPPSSLPADDLTRDGDVERNPGPAGRPPRARLFASSAPEHPFRCPFSSCSALGWATKAPLLAHLNGTHHKCGQFSDACFLAQMSWS